MPHLSQFTEFRIQPPPNKKRANVINNCENLTPSSPAQTGEFFHNHRPDVFSQMNGFPTGLYVESQWGVPMVPPMYFPATAGGLYVIHPLFICLVPHTPVNKNTLGLQ